MLYLAILEVLFYEAAQTLKCLDDVLYRYSQTDFLLRNISKMGCQFVEICYNECVATFCNRKSARHNK